MIKGIDVSKWQGVLNFADVKNNFDFIIIKATEGNGYVDTKFKANQAGLRATDICLGYYHFARPDLGNTAIAEADWFLKTLGEIKDGEVLCLDYEPTWGGDAVTWCYEFLNRVFAITKCRPLIYLNQSLVKSKNWTKIINENFGLWLAVYDYDAEKTPPATPWPMVAIKQYSNKLPFGSLEVDGNVFYGDTKAFKNYGYKSTTTPEPTPIPDPEQELTTEEKNILKFVSEGITIDGVTRSMTEGDVREGIGYVADNISEKIEKLETKIKTLTKKVKDLTDSQTLEGKTILEWQQAYDSASAEIQTWKKKSLQASAFGDIVAEIVIRVKNIIKLKEDQK